MNTETDKLSVTQAAALCCEGRNTVGYWVRSNKLYANRVGKKYSIPVEELVLFLKSTGRNIPEELEEYNFQRPCFRAHQNCWEFWQNHDHDHAKNCDTCLVFKNKLSECFISRDIPTNKCPSTCAECRFYKEMYFPKIQFIYQLALPAAICKGLYYWGANKKFADLCGYGSRELVGMGIEQIVHPESMESAISMAKKRALGDFNLPRTCKLFFKNPKGGKLKVIVNIFPVADPPGANLVMVEHD
jgi:hypothetical protein